VIYPSKELAGVAGLYNYLAAEPDTTILFSNDLGSSLKGIDCIAKDDQGFIICEAKGTSAIAKSASYYLRKTKTKGRQLSWEWIWSSLIDAAEDGRSAAAFLTLYSSIIRQQNIGRLLSISALSDSQDGYTIKTTSVVNESDLCQLNNMNGNLPYAKLRNWLDEIDPTT